MEVDGNYRRQTQRACVCCSSEPSIENRFDFFTQLSSQTLNLWSLAVVSRGFIKKKVETSLGNFLSESCFMTQHAATR